MALQTESTTFTRDVQGRYICSTWEEATSEPHGIDVVVLGSGMYGAYFGEPNGNIEAPKFYAIVWSRICKDFINTITRFIVPHGFVL